MPPIYNVIISNVPGPRSKLYFMGAEMEAYYPISALAHGQALNITVMSYAGGLYFGFTACHERVPQRAAAGGVHGRGTRRTRRPVREGGAQAKGRSAQGDARGGEGSCEATGSTHCTQQVLTMSAVPQVESEVRPRQVEVAIVGAGFGGLCLAIKLLEQGIRDFVILEKDAEVGGTWRDNQYPGAECDVQSHLYSYSFEGKPDWSQRYAGWKRDPAVHPRHHRASTGCVPSSASASR